MKHISRKLYKLISILMITVSFILLTVTEAFAYTYIDTDQTCDLTLLFEIDNKAISEVEFRVYLVADVDQYARLTLTGTFADSGVSVSSPDRTSEWLDRAAALAKYVSENAIGADASGVTDTKGSVALSGLKAGLYLIVGDTKVSGDTTYTPTEYLILLPNLDDTDNWVYSVTSEVKGTKDSEPGDTPGGGDKPHGGGGGGGGGGGTGKTEYSPGSEPIVTDEPSAQTGDTTHLDLYVLIMAVSALGMAIAGIGILRIQKGHRHGH